MAFRVCLEVPREDAQEIERETALQSAIYQFNLKPSRGIARVCEVCNRPATPSGIAVLLHTVAGLLSDRIGWFLSLRENEPVLRAYLLKFDLRVPFLAALRDVLTRLHLPREGEQIDQILRVWSQCWSSQNPDSPYDDEQAYVLAFACVLLNSDLHNPRVSHHMSASDFISNVRGVLGEECIPDSDLSQLYESIRSAPFEFRRCEADEFLALSGPRHKGLLKKKGGRIFSVWTAHYFVLIDSCLCYFRDGRQKSADEGPLGMIQLIGVEVLSVDDDKIQIRAYDGVIQYVRFERRTPELVRGVSTILLKASCTRLRDRWLYRILAWRMLSHFTGEPPVQAIDGRRDSDELATAESVDTTRSRSATVPRAMIRPIPTMTTLDGIV